MRILFLLFILFRANAFNLAIVFIAFTPSFVISANRNVAWPTSDNSFAQGKPLSEFIQATVSGKLESGLYGNTRNKGKRFHEGIDLRAQKHGSNGRAIDKIFSILPGLVAHVNRDPSKSSYGKYVVVRHDKEDVAVYSLYAHMSSIHSNVRPGSAVMSGNLLGIIGRTANNYTIPKEHAHLHFEIGLRLTNDFQQWYDKQSFDDPNHHEQWNGMNLLGFDPMQFFQLVKIGKIGQMSDYIARFQTAITVHVETDIVPDFARRYPNLLKQPIPQNGITGWYIGFTRYGFPVSLTPVTRRSTRENDKLHVSIVECDKSLMSAVNGRKIVKITDKGLLVGKDLRQFLEIMFGAKVL